MKTFYILMISAMAGAAALAKEKARNPSPLAVTLSVPARVGEWQKIEFSYKTYVNTTAKTLRVETPDQYGDVAICLWYPSGKTSSCGLAWLDPEQYPVTWTDRFYRHEIAPGGSLYEQEIPMSEVFGNLSPGYYRMAVIMPAHRYRVPGVVSRRLESRTVEFEVVGYAGKVAGVVDEARKPDGDVFLRVDNPHPLRKELNGRARAHLVNHTKETVEVTTMDGGLPCEEGRLTADADWEWKRNVGCGNVIWRTLVIPPGEEVPVVYDIPWGKGIYRLRATSKNGTPIVSDPITVD